MSALAGGGASGPGTGHRDLWILLAIVAGGLCPFLGKAYTIDDPLFLWLAHHVLQDPTDFFGFTVNWYGTTQPMHEVTRNPPLTGYYLAAAAALVGWSEVALHGAFLLPASAAIVATGLLARRLGPSAPEAALIGLLTPAFLVCSTNVSSDALLLALWSWSVWLWISGLDRGAWLRLLASAGLASLAALTKYFGIALVPLLLLHGLACRKRLGAWAAWLLLPVASTLAYELATLALYGSGLLLDGARYAIEFSNSVDPFPARRLAMGLVFAGGSFVPALVLAPLAWSRGIVAAGLGAAALGALALEPLGSLLRVERYALVGWSHLSATQVSLLGLGGASLVGAAIAELWRGRDSERWILVAWVLGTVAFATFVNWTNNGRSNLPMAPAVGILFARRLARRGAPRVALRAALVVSAAIALLVTWADYRWANDVRETARLLARRWAEPGRATLFAGHWGFQYYMEQAGAEAVDWERGIQGGQVFILPANNTHVPSPPRAHATLVDESYHPGPPVTTVSLRQGVNFYSSTYSILPFAISGGSVDSYQVWRAEEGFRFREWQRQDRP